MRIPLLLILLLSAGPLFGYSPAPVQQDSTVSQYKKADQGTYQLIIQSGGENELFTSDVLVLAEQLRKENERVLYELSPKVKLIILSRAEIRRPGFTPVPELKSDAKHK